MVQVVEKILNAVVILQGPPMASATRLKRNGADQREDICLHSIYHAASPLIVPSPVFWLGIGRKHSSGQILPMRVPGPSLFITSMALSTVQYCNVKCPISMWSLTLWPAGADRWHITLHPPFFLGMVSCCMVLPCVPLHIPSAKLHLSPLGAYMLMVSLGWSMGIELPVSRCWSLLWCLTAAVQWTLCLGDLLVQAQIWAVVEEWPADAG